LDKCVDELIQLVKKSEAFFGSEIIRSIASICSKEFMDIWNYIYELSPSLKSQIAKQVPQVEKTKPTPCWKCPACGKEFNNPRTAMNHILYLSRRRDASHRELYMKLKSEVTTSGKKFLEIISEKYVCNSESMKEK